MSERVIEAARRVVATLSVSVADHSRAMLELIDALGEYNRRQPTPPHATEFAKEVTIVVDGPYAEVDAPPPATGGCARCGDPEDARIHDARYMDENNSHSYVPKDAPAAAVCEHVIVVVDQKHDWCSTCGAIRTSGEGWKRPACAGSGAAGVCARCGGSKVVGSDGKRLSDVRMAVRAARGGDPPLMLHGANAHLRTKPCPDCGGSGRERGNDYYQAAGLAIDWQDRSR